MTLDELERPGPVRSAAVAAIAGRLTAGHAICRERAHASAPALLDAAIAAARQAGANMETAAAAIANLGRRQAEAPADRLGPLYDGRDGSVEAEADDQWCNP